MFRSDKQRKAMFAAISGRNSMFSSKSNNREPKISYEYIGDRPYKTWVINKSVGSGLIPIEVSIKEDDYGNYYVYAGEASVIYENAVKMGFSKALAFQKLKEGIDAGDKIIILSSDDVNDLESFGII